MPVVIANTRERCAAYGRGLFLSMLHGRAATPAA